nr:phage-related tail fiber protein [uncultured Mediterranean phage uvMED]
MADLKISALNSLAGADLVAADVVAVVDDSASETKKLTVSDLIANGTTLISDATIPSAKILFSAGSVATASVADAGITTAKVADSSITAAKLANNSSVTLVSTLPGSGDFTGQIALDTDDDKIYIWDGSAWDSVKGAGSINVVNGSTTGEINIVTSTSGDTVTVSATLDNTTAAAQFLAGPTGAGGTVGYRAIIGTDLPTASTSAKGGVIVNGNGLTMSSDTIAINNTVTAEASENHIVQYDANGLITGGRAIVAADVPVATSTVIGVVKPGSGLGVTGAGELNHDNSVTAGTASKVTFDTEGHITGTESLVAGDIPDLDAAKITTGTVPTARIASDAVTAEKLADRSTATIAETTPAGGAFIGQTHLNSITGDYFLWDGNVWQPIGISVGEIILAGTYNASTNLMATVTSEGTALSFVVGSALPAASSSNKGYYVVVSTAGTGTSPAPTVALNPPDFLLSTGTAYTEIDVSATVTAQQASNVAFTAAGNVAATNVQAAIEELDSEKVAAANPTLTGTVALGEDAVITFEGATDNAFETTLTVVDPTADRSLSLPNISGTLISSGDTGSVTSAMIADGAIVNADINASAEIAVSKLANGTARQLLQTDVAGSGVEFTSNVDVPGTLDVTGAATLDSTLTVAGVITANGTTTHASDVTFSGDNYSVLWDKSQDRLEFGDNAKATFGAGADLQIFHDGSHSFIKDDGTGEIKLAGTVRIVNNANTETIAKFTPDGSVELHYDNSKKFETTSLGATVTGSLLLGATSGTNLIRAGQAFGIATTDSFGGMSMSGFNGTTANEGPILDFNRSRATTKSPGTVLVSGDRMGSVVFRGDDGTDFADAAYMLGEVDGTPSGGFVPGRFTFYTGTTSATPAERMRITSAGYIGVNKSSPDRVIDVEYTDNTAYNAANQSPELGAVRIYNMSTTAGATAGEILFGARSSGSGYASITGISPGSQECELAFRVQDSATFNEALRINKSGNVGIGTSSAATKAHIDGGSTGTTLTVANGGYATMRIGAPANGIGLIAVDTGENLVFGHQSSPGTSYTERMRIDGSGNATFQGSISKGSGSFKIDHPLKPETHHLVHSFVESPQADNIYRGKVDLVDGTAAVNIDTVAGMTEGTFAALNREIQCFTTNETGWTAIKGSVTGNILAITAQDDACTDIISWLVIGERQDQHIVDTDWTDENGKVIVEPAK